MMFRRLVSLIPYSLSLRAMRHFAIPVFVIVVALAIRVGYAAWVEPAVGPTGGTPPPPINTSSVSQTKEGGLIVKGIFQAQSLAYAGRYAVVGTCCAGSLNMSDINWLIGSP